MSHREQLLILALLIVLVLLAILFPRPAASDAPVVASAVSQSEFEPVSIPRAAHFSGVPPFSGTPGPTAGISGQPGVPTGPRPAMRPPQASGTPSPSVRAVPSVAPVRTPATPARESSVGSTASVTGTASWFRSPRGVSAAGPALRTALGPGWRGTRVRVTGPAGSASTILGDWMAADRLIDLDDDVFPKVCGPLSRGICEAKVTW